MSLHWRLHSVVFFYKMLQIRKYRHLSKEELDVIRIHALHL